MKVDYKQMAEKYADKYKYKPGSEWREEYIRHFLKVSEMGFMDNDTIGLSARMETLWKRWKILIIIGIALTGIVILFSLAYFASEFGFFGIALVVTLLTFVAGRMTGIIKDW